MFFLPFPFALGFPGSPLKVNFVASTILSLDLVSSMNFPTSCSLFPLVYPSAVSTKFPPFSRYRLNIAREGSSSAPQPHSVPNVMVPRLKGLTRNPERPSVTYSLSFILWSPPLKISSCLDGLHDLDVYFV